MQIETIRQLMDTVEQHARGNPFTYVKGTARGRLLLDAVNSNTDGCLSLVDIDALECAYTHQDAILEAFGAPVELSDLETLARAIRSFQSLLAPAAIRKELTRLIEISENWCGEVIGPRVQLRHFLEEVTALATQLTGEHQHALDELTNAQVHELKD